MFRIKTDIRQYKCETRDKVEKLIRNWVIRPSDLIYNRDEREWLPIGEHPSFVGLFGTLAEQEKNTPDTVVTARSPYADRPPPADEVLDGPGPGNVGSEATDGEPEEPVVTHVVRRPSIKDSEVSDDESAAEDAPDPVDVALPERETDEVDAQSRSEVEDDTELPEGQDDAPELDADDEPEDRSEDEAPEEDLGEDSDEELDDEELDDAPEADSEPDAPDEPAEEPEGKARREAREEQAEDALEDGEDGEDARKTDVFDQDEIAESLAAEEPPAPPVAPEGVEPPSSNDEVTMMTEKTLEMLKVTDEDEAAEADDEATGVRERDDDPTEDEEDDDETTNVVPSPLEESEDDGSEDDDETTNVVPSPLEESEDDEGEDDDEADAEETAGTEAADDAEQEDESLESVDAPKLGRHDLPEELFATNEISSPEMQEKITKIDDLGELSEPSTPEEDEPAEEGATPRWGSRLDQDSAVEEAWDAIADDLGPQSEATEDELSPDDRDPAEDDDWDENEWEEEGWDEDTPAPAVPPKDFISAGYDMPLPFPMRPTAADVRKGLKLTRVNRSKRERTFPLPKPKKPYDVQRRTFDLTPRPPRDQTLFLVFGIFLFIGVIAVLVSTC